MDTLTFETELALLASDREWRSPRTLSREWIVKESLSRPRWGSEKAEEGEEWLSDCEDEPKFFSKWSCLYIYYPQRSTTTAHVLNIEQIFYGLAEKWKRETGGLSVISRRYAHPSYKALLDLGDQIVPMILRELKERPDWWFDAL